MHISQTKNLRRDNRGFASIVIALVLVLVLSLLTVGFAQLARREQQNALSKQLATQASYAAESGINDATKALAAIRAADAISPIDPNKCLDATLLSSSVIDPTRDVSYTCVLVNLKPPSLIYTGVSPDSNFATTFATTGSLSSLTVYWGSTAGKPLRPAGGFTPVGSWNSPAVLQFSITPLDQMDRTSLINRTFSVYLYPATTGGTVNYNTASQGQIIRGNCAAVGAYPCSVTIRNLPGGAGVHYLVHMITYYDKSNITIGNARDSSGTQLNFDGGQIQIDATGKAKNVLRRIQVRFPLTNPATLPAYPLEAQNICKRFSVDPANASFEPTDPSCTLN